MSPTTRKMSDRHEQDLVAILGGERTRNSGAVWSDQADGHQTGSEEHWRFAWDGKSTLGKSIGVSREMWLKLGEQSRGLEPLLPLRFYANDRLTEVDLDLGAVDLETLAALISDANAYRRMEDVGCAQGIHDHTQTDGPANGPCHGCGLMPYEAGVSYDPDLDADV